MNQKQAEIWQQRMHSVQQIGRDNDHRDAFQRDRARILHSAAFRRLQAKTQVHGAGMNDFLRTRLTHSLETAQIGSGILAQIATKQKKFSPILPSASLMESLCLCHDIGHPPFGHGGEVALNYMMRNDGGFEGNAQTFRIVTKLEPYTEKHGMNLSRRALLGLIKYPALLGQVVQTKLPPAVLHQRQLKTTEWAPAKGIYDCDEQEFNWVLSPFSVSDRQTLMSTEIFPVTADKHGKTQYKSLDCSIMELADDIAYGIHDLEDAIVLGMVNRLQWEREAVQQLIDSGDIWFRENIHKITELLFSGEHYLRKDAIGGIVNALITNIHIRAVNSSCEFEHPLLKYNAYLTPSMDRALHVFKQFVYHYVIQIPEVQIVEYKGQQMLIDIFEALSTNPERLLPDATKKKWLIAQEQSKSGTRVISDYISAMTDGYAQKFHQQLFSAHL